MGDGFDLDRYEKAREAAKKRSTSTTTRSAPRATGQPIKWKSAVPEGGGGGGGPSLLEQIPGAIFDAGKGLATGLVPAAWDSTVGNIGGAVQNVALRQDVNEIRDRKGPLGTLGRLFANEDLLETAGTGKLDLPDQFDRAAPILTMPAKSFAQTGKNVAELAQVPFTDKGFEDTTLAQASDEGQTVNWLLENVGNALFAGRLASGGAASAASRAGAGAPRLQRAASTLRRADDTLDRVMLAPLTVPAKGIAKGARAAARSDKIGGRLGTSALGQEAKRRRLTPSTRELSNTDYKWQQINAIRREDEAFSPAKRVQRILSRADEGVKKKDLRPPQVVRAAEGAMFLDLMDMRGLRALDDIRQASDEAFGAAIRQVADEFDNPTITPDAVGMYLDKLTGRLDERLSADIDRAGAEWVDRNLKGGLVRNVQGTEVVTGSEPNYIAGTGRLADTPEGPAQRAEALTSRERMFDNVDPESALSAPARFRNTINLNRAVANALAAADEFDLPEGLTQRVRESIPTGVDQILEEFDPKFVRSGRAMASRDPGAPSTKGPKAKRTSSEYAKEGGNVPLDVQSQAMLGATDIRRQTTNQMLTEVQQKYGIDPVAKYPDLEDVGGRELVEEVSAREGEPYVAWDPSRIWDQDGGLQRGESLKLTEKNTPAGATLVPKWVADSWDYAFSQQNRAAEVLIDKPTRAFKAAVLPLNSPRWLTGNAISGAIMAHAGKVSPVDLIKYGKRGYRAMKDYAEGKRSEVAREVLGTSHSASEARLFDGVTMALDDLDHIDEIITGKPSKQRRLPARALSGAVRKGYDINTWTDDWFRSVTYLKKLDEGLSPQQAVNESLALLGNFERLTPFERRVIRRAMPFYAWVKHITRLSTKLATEDPARVTWNLALPALFAPEDQNFDGPSWMRGMVRTGDDKFMSIGWAFPYSTTAETENPIEFLGGSLNPILTTPFSALTGIDPSFGRYEYLSTPGTPYGQSPGPQLDKLPYLVGKNFPQFQALYDELQRRRSGGEGQRLFDTGERMGREDPNKSFRQNLGRLFGIPLPRTYNAG